MNYVIQIQDMDDLESPLIEHYAERDSIELRWLGGDDKTEPLIGSEVNYTLENFRSEDGKFLEHFTSNEKKWRVTNRVADTDEIVWRGYLLPESYTEPWENNYVSYVGFSAVDGIGLLKGKKLSPDFYSEEKTVIEVLCACLDLTRVDFDLYFAPAIQNHLKKDWHDILIDTAKYHDPEKLPSAYDFLEELVSSLQCQLFQAEGRWYVEGINKRHLPSVKFWVYALDASFKGTFSVDKNIKKVGWVNGPLDITMVPPLREVTVTHEAATLEIPKEVIQETDISWAVVTGVAPNYIARHWNFPGTWYPTIYGPDYFLELTPTGDTYFNQWNVINLRNRLYVLKGTKVRFKLAAELVKHVFFKMSQEQISQRIDNNTWADMLVYQVLLNDTVIYHNLNPDVDSPVRLIFNSNLQAKVQLEFIASENGYLDIALFQPVGVAETIRISRVRITELVLEDIEQESEFIYTETIDPDSSVEKDIDLAISDDYSGHSKSFYLERQRQYSDKLVALIGCPILYGKQVNGKNYSIVSLRDAVLIDQFPGSVYRWPDLVNPITILGVEFNRQGGEEMAVETAEYFPSGHFTVKPLRYELPGIDRTEWLKWSDSIYEVEQKPYAQVVAEIYRNLFSYPHLRITGIAEAPVKFNDLIEFTYRGERKYFVPTDISWRPDENESEVTLVEGVYAGNSTGGIPPYVDAGPDIYIDQEDTTAQVTEAVENAPGGYIVSRIWEQISGSGATYASAGSLNPLIQNISEDITEHRITVTDNNGLTGSDTMRVLKNWKYLLSLDLIDTSTSSTLQGVQEVRTYQLNFDPSIPVIENLILRFRTLLTVVKNHFADEALANVQIFKEGVQLYSYSATSEMEREDVNIINYNSGDLITVQLRCEVVKDDPNLQGATSAEADFSITAVTFQETSGIVSNLPVSRNLLALRD